MSENSSWPHPLIRFCGLLLAAQAVRALFSWLLMKPLHLEWKIANPAVMLLMGIFVWLITKPSLQDLGLDLSGLSATGRWANLAAIFVVGAMLITTLLMAPDLWLENLNSLIITPVVEEFIFRGLGWSRLSKSLPQKNNQLWVWVLVSVLFGIWHFFYADALLWYAPVKPALANLPTALLWKFLIGGFIGGAAGLLRWKTKHLPFAFFVHALFNMFGR